MMTRFLHRKETSPQRLHRMGFILAMLGLMLMVPASISWGNSLLAGSDLKAEAISSRVTVNFTGEVFRVDNSKAFNGIFNKGDTITGSYSYDLLVRDSDELNLRNGLYQGNHSPFEISLTIPATPTSPSITFGTNSASPHGKITMLNQDPGNPSDEFEMESLDNTDVKGVPISQITWNFIDPSSKAITSDALLPLAPDLNAWATHTLAINGPVGSGGFVAINIVSLQQECTCRAT
jgi:hypothetical protein